MRNVCFTDKLDTCRTNLIFLIPFNKKRFDMATIAPGSANSGNNAFKVSGRNSSHTIFRY